MVLYKGYCRPLGKKVDFTVKDVISMNTKRGIKWRVKGTYDNYNISTFCSKLVAEDLLNKLPLAMDAEIAYTPASPTYESEELLPLFSNATKKADEIEAEEETIEVQEQIQENTNAQELDLHSEKLPAKYYKKNGSLDMRYSICREYAAKRAESQKAVELEAPYTPVKPERPSDDYGGGGKNRRKPRRPLGAERGRKAWLEKCDICSEGPIYEKDVNIEDYDDPIQVCQSCFDDIFTDKAAESFEAEERWYVSDPCYAIPEDRWGEFVNKLPDNLKNKKVDVKWEVDGKEYIVEVWQSPGGDGVWSFPSLNCDFGVDAGLLAVIPEKVAMEGKRPFGGKWFNKKPTLFTDEKKYVVKINNKRNKNVDNRFNPFDAESFEAQGNPDKRTTTQYAKFYVGFEDDEGELRGGGKFKKYNDAVSQAEIVSKREGNSRVVSTRGFALWTDDGKGMFQEGYDKTVAKEFYSAEGYSIGSGFRLGFGLGLGMLALSTVTTIVALAASTIDERQVEK